ncbi:MAG: SHD1 domain-containing protein [Pirellulaceae bacterium]
MTRYGRAERALILAGLFLLLLSTALAAEEPTRLWRDKTGRFEVEAKLLSHADGKVQLLKNDGRAVTVPLTLLSDADQQYLKNLANPANPFAGGAPAKDPEGVSKTDSAKPDSVRPAATSRPSPASKPSAPASSAELLMPGGEVGVLPADAQALSLTSTDPLPALPADPGPAAAPFREFTAGLMKTDAYARFSQPVLVDNSDLAIAVSINRTGNISDPATFGRVYLARPSAPKADLLLDGKATINLLAHDQNSGRSLAAVDVDQLQRGGDLVLLEGLLSGQPKLVARWRVPGWDKPGTKPRVEFARLLDAETALVQVDYGIYVWNLVTGEGRFAIERIRAGSKIAVSPTGKYLLIPYNGGCKVVDVAAGALVGVVQIPSTLVPEVAVSPDGARLALVFGSEYYIWDIANGVMTANGTLSNVSGKFYGWIGDRYLLTQLAGLIQPDLGMTLWKYSLPSTDSLLAVSGGVILVHRFQDLEVKSLPTPHGAVAAIEKKLSANDDKLLLVRPGSKVSLKLEAVEGVDRDLILSAMQAAVQKAGWIIEPGAPIEVVATIGRAEKQTMYFRPLGRPLDRPLTATITPYTVNLQVVRGGESLWTTGTTNMIPHALTLEAGETVQQAVTRNEKPDPRFFQWHPIPPSILRPEVAKTIGRSQVLNGVWRDFFPK